MVEGIETIADFVESINEFFSSPWEHILEFLKQFLKEVIRDLAYSSYTLGVTGAMFGMLLKMLDIDFGGRLFHYSLVYFVVMHMIGEMVL